MKIETILNAMEKVRVGSGWDMDRRIRQYNAFRARILRMDAEKDELEELRTEQWGEIMRQAKRIAELEADKNKPGDIWGGLL